jgi:hypothetical protein
VLSIDVLEIAGDEFFLEDGYHLSEHGNTALAAALVQQLNHV